MTTLVTKLAAVGRQLRAFLTLRVVVAQIGAVKATIRPERGQHRAPHVHLKLGDRVDASVSLSDFHVFADSGDDKRALKRVLATLKPRGPELLFMWDEIQAGRSPPSLGQLIP